MKSNRKGLSGWTLMPFNIGGLNSGLRWTITPGAGRRKSWVWAKGIGPKELTKKAIRTNMWAMGVLTYLYQVKHIDTKKQGLGKSFKKPLSLGFIVDKKHAYYGFK